MTEPSTRRAVLASGAGVAIAGAAAGLAYAARPASAAPTATGSETVEGLVPFRGERQAGITTAAQDRLHFVALDVVTDDAGELQDLLTAWTRAAERMTYGAEAAPGGVVGGGPWGVPQDTGEALDLEPANLTVTIGYGPSLFDDRFGLADRRPEALRDLPAFVGDDLDPPPRVGTCASRRAPTTRRSRCTRCATSCGWASASSRCGGASSASAARPRRRRPR